MSKENKHMLKEILSNQEMIMTHLGITKPASKEEKKDVPAKTKKIVAKISSKKPAGKKK